MPNQPKARKCCEKKFSFSIKHKKVIKTDENKNDQLTMRTPCCGKGDQQ